MSHSILLVDDEESLRYTLERFLMRAGHRVVTAGTCHEARERIDQGAFDVILTDLSLPDGSGMDLVEEIRRKCPGCPVIVITADPSAETALDAFFLGAFDYLAKPVRQREVMQCVDLALRKNRGGEPEKI